MSLAQQLRKLQIPGQASIQQVSTKKSSLLFDLKTAATLDNEAIQDIGYHGFKELTLIDSVFSRFESIFDRNSVQFQRNYEKEEVTSKLQKKLSNFLILLSPYLLLKPAQKALEWLVRRYQSHIWDKEALIACILPYHETNIFGRIVQLFGNQPNNDKWDWLLSCQKEGKGFNTQALVQHCTTNRMLMAFIFKMADDATEVLKFNPKSGLKTIFSFHARMFVAVMDATPAVSEDVLSFLLPYIHSGLKSGVRDYVCSTYMGIAGLASKTKFMKDVCKAVLATILKSMKISWYEEGFLCLLSVIQLQRVKSLSQRIFKLFLSLQPHRTMEVLTTITKDYDISRFVELFIPLLCSCAVAKTPELSEKATLMLTGFADDLDLSDKHISLICRSLIQKSVEVEDDTNNVPEEIRTLIVHLSKRYSSVFDECFAKFFRDHSGDSLKLTRLKQMSTSFLSEKHHANGDSDFPLVLSLNHPEGSIRITAVDQLFGSMVSGASTGQDAEFFRDAVLSRLDDDDPAVVKTVLKYPEAIVQLLPANILHDLVLKMMGKSGHYNLNELIVAVLKGLEGIDGTSQKSAEFVYAVLAQVLFSFTVKCNRKLVDTLGTVELASSNVIMKGISAALTHIKASAMLEGEDRNEVSIIPLFTTFLDHITDAIAQCDNTMAVVVSFWNYVQALPVGHDLQFLRLMIVLLLVEKCPLMCGNVLLLDFSLYVGNTGLLENISASEMDNVSGRSDLSENKKYLFSRYYAMLNTDAGPGAEEKQNQLLSQGFYVLLKAVIQTLVNNRANVTELSVAKESLFGILASCALNGSHSCYRDLLNSFLAGVFKDKGDILIFLCSLYLKLLDADTEMNDKHFEAAVCSLHITRSLIADTEQERVAQDGGIVYATHLSLLQCPLPLVRDIVLDNIAAMSEKVDKQNPWFYLLQHVIENKNEISIDASHCKKCLQSAFDIKEASAFSAFNKSSKKEKVNAVKKSSLQCLTSALKKYPVVLQLSVIDSLSLVDPKHIMGDCIEVLEGVIAKSTTSHNDAKLVQLILNSVKAEMMDSFNTLFPLFVECLHHPHSLIQNTALKMIHPTFFNRLRSFELQKGVVVELLKLLQNSSSVNLSTTIRISLKDLNLSPEIINIFLQQFCEAFDQFISTSIAPLSTDFQLDVSDDDLKFPMWRTLTEILEAITCKEEFGHLEKLVPKLFRVLERCLKCTGVEYVKQLALTSLITISREDLSALSEDQFQVELLVQCLQSSDNTQTSQQVLQVLSNVARVYPTLVLHNIMHIFSFMGGTMLRLDNAYSFEIMEKTINAVIPVLIKKEETTAAARKRPAQASVDEIVTFILQTFVDSIPHCPEHRRLHIIRHLVSILQEEEYLHLVMILLLKKVSRRNQKHTCEEQNMQLSPISLEFCKDLFVTYSIPTQVHALFQMIGFLNTTPEKDAPVPKKASKKEDDDGTRRDWKESNMHKYVVLTFAEEILGGANIRSGYEVKVNEQQQLTHLYLQLIEELLEYTDMLSKSSDEGKSRSKSLQKKVSDVVSQLYDLLPFDSFISIMSELLCKDNELMRKKSLELLCKKLGNLDQGLTEMQEHSLIELFKVLMPLVKYKEKEDEIATNKQMMLYAIKLIASKLITKQKEHFLKAVPIIAQLYTLEEANEMLAINAMLCVAELSSLLKKDMIPYLPIVMEPLLKKTAFDLSYKEQLLLSSTECQKSSLVITSSVTILHTLLKSLANFCSPYVSDFIFNVSTYDVIAKEVLDASLMKKVASLKMEIGKSFPPRVLYPAIEKCFSTFLTGEKQRTVSMVEIYQSSFKTISKSDANSNYSNDILNITKTIFDVHTVIGSDDSLCDTLESLAIQAFDDLILKLTENTLRPMYLELLNWATESGGVSRRLLSFFRLSLQLSKSLKSLFLLFVGHILKNANDILSNLNTANGNPEGPVSLKIMQDLVVAVVDTLTNCFIHDSQGFINKERFETLLQPLVDQMENKLHGEEYLNFAKDHLTPCIVNFSTVVNDSSCWKQLNHKILTRTKCECENVRLISLYMIEKMCHHMGESYMVLIPETIPFLAEILEDDSLEVEKQCQSVIKVIEEISGESIQKYF